MRISVAALLVAVVVFATVASAAPAAGGEDEHGDRHVRVTCDLLSAFGVEDSACAARCIAMNKGYKGGHCEGGVCHCRR